MATVLGMRKDSIESLNPITGEIVGTVPIMGPDEIHAAVAAAREEASAWEAFSPRDRARHLHRVRQAIVDHSERLANTIVAETGKPLPDAYFEVFAACGLVSYAASAGPRALEPTRISTWPYLLKRASVCYSPYGVIGVISPWNYPLGIPMQILPAALIAGNAVVLKPSELTPMTGRLIGEVVASAGRPLVQVITGDGRTGEALVRSGVEKVAFTGSPATGRRILAAAAESLTPVVMELGGKDAMIVTDRADVAVAARAAVGAAFSNSGQTCMAIERVYVTRGAYDPFVECAMSVTRGLRQGSGSDAHVGAITNPRQLEVLERRLADAVARGARVLVGGRRASLPGMFFEPTIVVDVDSSAELMREETFGPILPIVRVDDLEEAIRLANACDFGLNASVFSRDRAEARGVARRLVSGGVNINDAMVGAGIPALPFGGEKQSGFGRLQGVEGIREFCRKTSIVENRFPKGLSLAAKMFTGPRPNPEALRRVIELLYSHGAANRFRGLVKRHDRIAPIRHE